MTTTDWKKLEIGLNKYLQLMRDVHLVDVTIDKEFQKKFKGFYRIRRGQQFCELYFSILEQNKKNDKLEFETVLYELLNLEAKRLEASFASKLIATINPEMPIWDKVVLSHIKKDFGRFSKDVDRVKGAVEKYKYIANHHENLISSQEGVVKLELFNQKFPDVQITNIKKIDLILWQTR